MSQVPEHSKNTWYDYLQYFRGVLSPGEKQRVEKRMMQDTFDTDAFDGLSSLAPGELQEDILSLQRRLEESAPARRRRLPLVLRYAAVVALLLGVGGVFYLVRHTGAAVQQLARQLPVTDTVQKVATDSFHPGIAYLKEAPVEKEKQQPEPLRSEKPAPSPQKAESEEAAPQPAHLEMVEDDEVALESESIKVQGEQKDAWSEPAAEAAGTPAKQDEMLLQAAQAGTSRAAIAHSEELVGVGHGSSKKTTAQPAPRNADTDIRLDRLMEDPQPIAGLDAFHEYIRKQVNYSVLPVFNVAKNVVLRFSVNKNGEIENIQVVKTDGPEYSQEAIRLLKDGPPWQPGSVDGMPATKTIELRIKLEARRE